MLVLLFVLPFGTGPAPAGPEDESVFVKGPLPGQHESLLYVWTSDADAKSRALDPQRLEPRRGERDVGVLPCPAEALVHGPRVGQLALGAQRLQQAE